MKNIFDNNLYFLKVGLISMVALFAINAPVVSAAPFGEMLSFWNDREDNNALVIDHSNWQKILDNNLSDDTADGVNRFDYDGISNDDKELLETYLVYLQTIEPRQLNSKEQMAYWVNLYNATTVFVVLEESPGIKSIRQIRSGLFSAGPWDKELLRVVQQDLSLNDIEHGILRPIWRDERIHYAVNCASIGCPNLLKTAFTGENIEALLEEAAKQYINHPRAVSVKGNELTLSSIFNWYADDFGEDFDELMEHLLEYATPELAQQIETFNSADYDYDWSINSIK